MARFTIQPINTNFAAEVFDIDLSKKLSNEDIDLIKEAFWKYAVLVFPDQNLSLDQHVDFATLFGPIEMNVNTYQEEVKKHRFDYRVSDISNLDEEDNILSENSRKRMSGLANRLWHTDSIFRHTPALASALYALTIVPIGGKTEFADTRAAWDALPDIMKNKIEKLIVEHSIFHSRAKIGFTNFTEKERAALPPSRQVLIRTIPENQRKALYIASHAMRIIGMSDHEGSTLLDELMTHATQSQFVYSHRWRVGDLVIWDNRCTLHRGTDYDEKRFKRDMRRATVSDVGNSVELTFGSLEAS
jgi:alpha-ketoglutarate-dependent 2,4-dichlorophenoxyacetate dioxygenase